MADDASQEIARNLAGFLTSPPRYGGKSPLEEMLQAQITQMTRQIAAEVIEAMPELRDHVRTMVEQTIRRGLTQDQWLNQTVVSAVAKAITDLSLERQRDSEGL